MTHCHICPKHLVLVIGSVHNAGLAFGVLQMLQTRNVECAEVSSKHLLAPQMHQHAKSLLSFGIFWLCFRSPAKQNNSQGGPPAQRRFPPSPCEATPLSPAQRRNTKKSLRHQPRHQRDAFDASRIGHCPSCDSHQQPMAKLKKWSH